MTYSYRLYNYYRLYNVTIIILYIYARPIIIGAYLKVFKKNKIKINKCLYFDNNFGTAIK